MSDSWDAWRDDVDDEDDVVAPAVPRPRDPEPTSDLSAPRYPRPQQHTPPPGLSRRQQRRWLRDVRREERADINATAVGWRRGRNEPGPGLAVAVLAVVLVLAAWVWWPRAEDAPRPDASSVASAAPTFRSAPPRPESSAPSAGARTTAPADGNDHGAPPAPPAGMFGDPAGQAVYGFVLGYLTYSPAAPDPVGTWVAGWAPYASDQLVDGAAAAASPLWDFTVRQAVHVVDPRVIGASREGGNFYVDATWTLFPIGGAEDAVTTTEHVDLVVTVTDGKVSAVTVTPRGSGQ